MGIMSGDEFDRVEVDHLIRALSSPAPKPKSKPAAPVAAKAAEAPAPAQPPATAAPAVRPVTQLPRLPMPVRRSLADRLAADTMREPDRWQKLRDFGDRIRLPLGGLQLAGFPQLRMPQMPRRIDLLDPVMTVRLWVGLGVALAAAMPFWPYPKTNAWWVVFYMFAVVMVVIAGVWSARLTWVQRLGVAHIVALGIVLWGITLWAGETLPMIGYAAAGSTCPLPTDSRG
jgi:hypothetical protein